MSASDQAAPLPPSLLLSAVRRLLRPLVLIMIRNGLTFPVLADALRSLFIDVAATELLTDPGSRTDSRISLLTGVHRKEIRRQRETPADAAAAPPVLTLIGELVSRWLANPIFLDAAGQPKALPRTAPPASGLATFEQLVESVTTDIRPRAVLDELLGQGAVFLDSEDCVQLNVQAFIPRPGGEEQLFYFARNLHDHVAVAVANISAAGCAPFLDRSVHYDALTENQATALEDYARQAAVRVLLDVNRQALALSDTPTETAPALQRVNFGIYVLRGPDQAAGQRKP